MLASRHKPAPGSPSRAQIEGLLSRVSVVAKRERAPNYMRGCGSGQGCVFGPAWSDDYEGPYGHDGCDTRNNVLALQLSEVSFRPGTHNCVVVAGVLADPYSGKQIEFRKRDAGAVQIDHVYPLAAAWDMGASAWDITTRVRFANDVDGNLLAVSGPANQAKGDATPAKWLPPASEYHCFYAGKYLTVALRYGLPVTVADQTALQRVARGCG
ncbi:HNH endonuclease family protein [Skermania sp. ID1734]|uniref:HNH endonuclease family protein n=1 Tax=Skermania sp. ID1734 TaxID=2597516 RepID=UPI0021078E90|nr:HNH endonuclease family protein [Skermania sp. ID1734]